MIVKPACDEGLVPCSVPFLDHGLDAAYALVAQVAQGRRRRRWARVGIETGVSIHIAVVLHRALAKWDAVTTGAAKGCGGVASLRAKPKGTGANGCARAVGEGRHAVVVQGTIGC